MLNHSAIKFLLFLFCILSMLNPNLNAQINKDRPNFIVIVTDDQGYGDAGYLGNDDIITPNLDQMARSSFRLNRHYSAPVCSPTRASILTGRHPNRTGVFLWGHALRPQEQSVATLLRDNGYQTGFFGKWHLGSLSPEQPTSPSAHGFETWYAAANFYDNDPWMSHNGKPVHLTGESSDVTVDLALKYIEEAKGKDDPFLVFICLGSPHLPHQAADYLKNLYPEQPENMKNYLGEITGIDLAIGKLRNQLKEWGLSGETLLWFSSDNGGKLPEANNGILKQQKGTLYEGGIRIPALIEWPGQIPVLATNVVTGTVDVFPTLLDLADVDPSQIEYHLDGISLVPLFEGKINSRAQPLGFWSYHEIKGHSMKSDQIIQNYQKVLNGEMNAADLNEGLLNTPEQDYPGMDKYPYSGTYAWIENDWKLIQEGTSYQLYNLAEDPGENHDLSEEHPERANRMKKELKAWLVTVVKSVQGQDY